VIRGKQGKVEGHAWVACEGRSLIGGTPSEIGQFTPLAVFDIQAPAFSLRAVDVSVTLAGAVSVLLLNVIGLTLPAAPGHVGTIQLAFLVGLAPFGVPKEEAFAASVIYNFLMFVPTMVLGFPGLRRAGEVLRERLGPD